MTIKLISVRLLRCIVNIILFLIFFFPFYWLFITSFKTLGATMVFPPKLFPDTFLFQNYVDAFKAIPFLQFIENSLVVTVTILILQMLTIVPAAYGFARYNFKGRSFFFGMTMLTMMIPVQLTFLPVFIMFSNWGMINSYWSLILPFASNAFGIFMLRQTFKQVPHELIEAAKLDGASEYRILTKIFLPLARPTLITIGMLTFIDVWNDYFWPLVMTTNDAVRTLPVGIAALRQVESGIHYNILMAGNVMLILPIIIVFILAQKQIIRAFTYFGSK
ncbi:carbohydrate ABC transporter permease [Pectinatus sottacetonis]|uniref:carbohydrate ABC transporter permease n=1 Tax=Pectinatus sottacetonis TaxID=1002795 RepID=UPI0018C53832|nr:carbohydrate ABC transporter permease [Pectinatus sottacetonis]